MRRTIALLLGIVLMTCLLAACSEDAATTAEVESQASESAMTAALDGAQGEALRRIIENGKLIMLTNAAFPPYEYRTADGQIAGIDVDLGQAIADQIGVELQVVDMEFDSLIPALQSGRGDIVVAGLTITDERSNDVDFSDTYADSKQMIVVPAAGSIVASEADLPGKVIGVQVGTTGEFLASGIAGAKLSHYKSGLEAAEDLTNGRIDAIVIDVLPAENIVAQNGDLALIDLASSDEQYAVAVAKNNEDLLEIANDVIAKMQSDGSLADSTAWHVEEAQSTGS